MWKKHRDERCARVFGKSYLPSWDLRDLGMLDSLYLFKLEWNGIDTVFFYLIVQIGVGKDDLFCLWIRNRE